MAKKEIVVESQYDIEELVIAAKVLNATYEQYFVLSNGEQVK